MLLQPSHKIQVIHFQRRPRPGFNFSIESIFENLRSHLKDKVDFSVAISGYFNDGYWSKVLNILQATFRAKRKVIAHITGEVYFLAILMPKKNVLLTIHDCRFMERKTGLAKKLTAWLYLKQPVKNAAQVTVISESTKAEVARYTKCPAEKITVIPNSVDNIFQPSPKTFNKDCPVILQVGAAFNKNLGRLAQALNGIHCKLVVIGNILPADLEKLQANKIDFTLKTNLTKEQLYREYINCDILAFASTYEGFGMPVIEANCVERAVLTSTVSSLPGVAGNAACLVDPYKVEDIRNGLLSIIEDDAYRAQLIENGRKNRLRFNADIIADAYYQLYKKMAKGLT
jgi:glycosyltransferase involved in cell wall biosynthesis